MKYTLVNPSITGTFNSTINAKSASDAAQKFYSEMSTHFTTAMPSYFFSFEDKKNNMYHYEVKETLKDNNASYTISQYNNTVDLDKFNQALAQHKAQAGGKKKHDDSSSSSSSSSSDYMIKWKVPIYSWWYYPYIYSWNNGYVYQPNIVSNAISPSSSIIWSWPYV